MAREALAMLGMAVFCPYDKVSQQVPIPGRTRYTDDGRPVHQYRIAEVKKPIFRGYCFVDTLQVWMVNQARGVLSVVNVAGRPLEVPQRAMDRLMSVAVRDGDDQDMCSTVDISRPSHTFKLGIGDEFVVRNSAFHGFVAMINSIADLDRTGELRAWVQLFGRTNDVLLSVDNVGRVVSRASDHGSQRQAA